MKITALSILLAVGFLPAPRSIQAQTGIPNQPSEVACGTQAAATANNTPAKPSRWFARIGVVGATYHSGATIATNGKVIPGGTAKVSNNLTVIFDVGYDITKNFSVLMTLGVPPKPIITGKGTVASLNELGKVRYGPAIFTGYYRFPKWGALRPYAGAGAAYAIILKEHDATVSQLKVYNNWGFVLQTGAEYELTKQVGIFVDFKEIWLAVDAKGALSGAVPVTARVKLDPSLVSVGVKFHFQQSGAR